MGRKALVTRERITAAFAELRARGEEPTQRKVLAITGGGGAEVLKLYNEVRAEEQTKADTAKMSRAAAAAAEVAKLARSLYERAEAEDKAAARATLDDIANLNDEIQAEAAAAREEAAAAKAEVAKVTAERAADKERESAAVAAAMDRMVEAERRAAAIEVKVGQMEIRAITAEQQVAELAAQLAAARAATKAK